MRLLAWVLRRLDPDPPEMALVCPHCGAHPFTPEYLDAHPELAQRLGLLPLR